MTFDTTDRRVTARMTAVLVATGAALVLGMGAAHGDLPEGSGEAALRFVASRPYYALIHFGSIVGGVLWAAGLRNYPQLLDDPRARLVAGWGSAVAAVGASVLAVQFSLDGFGLPALADRFAAADPVTRATLGNVAEITADAMVGLALLWVILLYGVAIGLLAVAGLLQRSRPSWVGVAGLAVGAWNAGAALTVALGGTVVPDWLAFVSGIVGGDVWLIAWAVTVWRQPGREPHRRPVVERVGSGRYG